MVLGRKKAWCCMICMVPEKETCFLFTISTTLPSFFPEPCLILVILTRTSSPLSAVLKSVGNTKISCSNPCTMIKPMPDLAISNTPLYVVVKWVCFVVVFDFFLSFLLFICLLMVLCYKINDQLIKFRCLIK